MLPRGLGPALGTLLAGLLAAGCSSSSDLGASGVRASTPGSSTGAVPGSITAPAGFAPSSPPAPAGTFTPRPGSWSGVDPPPGFRVVLLTTERDRRTRVLSTAVRSWARDVRADLSVVVPEDPDHYIGAIQQAIDEDPDLVIATGEGLVDPLALVTASNLDTQFLVVGAELAEPTLNVTAADWRGASYRGEGLGQASTFDPRSFTPERARSAVRAGVAAVLTGLNGTVVWVR